MPLPRITEPVTLAGPHARLEPLSAAHEAGLVDAVRDGRLWELWYTAIPSPEGMGNEIQRRLALHASGSMLPFTVFDAGGRIVGMSTYMNIDAPNRRVEIGSTWYAASAQRTPLNTQCKRLLLAHASRRWNASRSSSAPTASTSRAAAPSSGWGRSWTAANLSNTSFRVRVLDVASGGGASSRDFSLDWVAVRVSY